MRRLDRFPNRREQPREGVGRPGLRACSGLLSLSLLWLLGSAMPAAARFVPVAHVGFAGEVTCLAPDANRLYIGTRGGGLFSWDGPDHPALPAAAALSGRRIHDCSLVAGQLWLASDAGLIVVDPAGAVRTWAAGRALRVVDAAGVPTAVMADGRLLRVVDGRLEQRAIDVTPMAMAAAADGRWAVGGFGGVHVGQLARTISLPAAQAGRVVEEVAFALDGRLLVRAGGSVFAFDGARFEPVEAALHDDPPALSERSIRARAHFAGRSLWATDAGVVYTDAGRLVPLALPGMPCGERVIALSAVGDALWVGGFDSGLCRFQAGRWQRFFGPQYLPSDMINDLASDGERLFVATTGGLAIVHADGRFEQRTHGHCEGATARACPYHATVTGVTRDAVRDRMWVADAGAVHGIRSDSGRWQHLFRQAGITSKRITRLAVHDGVVAAGTVDQGVLLKRGRRFARFDDQDGLSDNWVTDLAFAADGALWVSTCTRGVTRVAPDGRTQRFGRADGLVDDYALSVVPFTDGVFVGTLSGLSIVTAAGVENLTLLDGLSGNEVHDVVQFQGAYWVATDAGLSVLAQVGEPAHVQESTR